MDGCFVADMTHQGNIPAVCIISKISGHSQDIKNSGFVIVNRKNSGTGYFSHHRHVLVHNFNYDGNLIHVFFHQSLKGCLYFSQGHSGHIGLPNNRERDISFRIHRITVQVNTYIIVKRGGRIGFLVKEIRCFFIRADNCYVKIVLYFYLI